MRKALKALAGANAARAQGPASHGARVPTVATGAAASGAAHAAPEPPFEVPLVSPEYPLEPGESNCLNCRGWRSRAADVCDACGQARDRPAIPPGQLSAALTAFTAAAKRSHKASSSSSSSAGTGGKPSCSSSSSSKPISTSSTSSDGKPSITSGGSSSTGGGGKQGAGVLLSYDDRCRSHIDPEGGSYGRDHPERPERVAAIMVRLHAAGLLDRCVATSGRAATDEELLAVHDKALLAAVERASAVLRKAGLKAGDAAANGHSFASTGVNLEALDATNSPHIMDVYFNASTAACARLAAGSAADVARRVATGAARHGAAIIRPPGHHAESSVAMGFCYYNNAAVAARAAQAAGAKRVLIMDWDVHHGNGTQHSFEQDPTVLYISTHRYDNGRFFPGSGASTESGRGAGAGYTVNVPWNGSGVSDADMLAAFRHVIVPIAAEFAPDLVIVSAGFDAVEGDPLGGCRVSPAAFGHFTAMLSALAPTVLLLEGGYNLTATAAATEACVRVLLGETPQPLRHVDTPAAASSAAAMGTKSTGAAVAPYAVVAPYATGRGGGQGSAGAQNTQAASILEGVSDKAALSIQMTLEVHQEFWQAARKQLALVTAAIGARQ